MKKKIVIALLACLMLAGCGKKEETTNTANTTNTTETGASDESVESTAVDSEKEKIYRETDFRFSKWGDTTDKVLEAEGREPFGGNESMLMYKADISGHLGKVMYVFDDTGLYSVVYDITSDVLSPAEWLDYYDELENSLIDRYGEPDSDVVIALDGSITEATPEALEERKISLQTGWTVDKANIWMQLMRTDDGEFFISVVAMNPKTATEQLDKATEEAAAKAEAKEKSKKKNEKETKKTTEETTEEKTEKKSKKKKKAKKENTEVEEVTITEDTPEEVPVESGEATVVEAKNVE